MTSQDVMYTAREMLRLEALRSRINVARAISIARVEHGLTQDELGRQAGTKQSRVSEVEGMRGNLRFDTLDRITRTLGLMIDLVPRERPVALAFPSAAPVRRLAEIQVQATGSSTARWPISAGSRSEVD